MKNRVLVTLVTVVMLLMISVSFADSPDISSLELGASYTDLQADLKFLTFRTDILDKLGGYAEDFCSMYPGITITYEGVENYEADMLLRLSSGQNWGDIMMIPLALTKEEASERFMSFGEKDMLSKMYNFTDTWAYNGQVYGLGSMGNAYGLLYNKRLFAEAKIDTLPKNPDEFLEAMHKLDDIGVIPLYTNYADVWPMSCWDAYLSICSTGDNQYLNYELVHATDPFSDYGDGTHPYAVYKLLYDIVAEGLTEEDYTTTSEEQGYSLLNNGEVGVLVFASWAYKQAYDAGDHGEDLGYMPFPISIDDKQYVGIGPDYAYGINNSISEEKQIAALLYIKYLIEETNFDFDEGAIPVVKGAPLPKFYSDLEGCVMLEDMPATADEEGYFGKINMETGLAFNANGNRKVQEIVESAFAGSKSFDEIMENWNKLWTEAQDYLGITRQ